MDKVYDHKAVEEKIYKTWEAAGYFKPEINTDAFESDNPADKYTIVLPPPNANGDLHFGHAMYVLEDILIRYHRMKGMAALWLPGSDHAGTETQFVFEKHLQKEGKSRFDFNRVDLYKAIWEYVEKNRGGIEQQLRRLGFSLDWSREKFTLDPDVVELVKQTFRKMYEDKLVYRDYRLVNYCTRDGTSFSDLETVSEEKEGVLYHINFPIKDGGVIPIATTRPETMVGDVAVMVHPEDPRYKDLIGKTVILPIVNREIPIIADEYVDREFGTGAVKVTPSHDFNDFEIARKHELTFPPIIGWDGKMQHAGELNGLYAKQAREKIVELLKKEGLLVKEVPHKMVIKICYKCKTILEPLPLEQWYIKIEPLRDVALKAIDSGAVDIFPKNFTSTLKFWYKNLRDWNISRQNVWGIQIPIWYEVTDERYFAVSFIDKKGEYQQGLLSELLENGFSWEEITSGLQRVIARMEATPVFEDQKEKDKRYLPETDTFDTWFSSAQWPYVTLQTTKPGDFEKFYPTSVMETGRDILFFWVSRMLMMGVYRNGDVPFRTIVLHGLVNDPLGKKMSKSKGNVVNPLEVVDQYGADSVRMALVYGTALGNDQAMSYPKLEAMRKFSNKLWNMGRFIEFKKTQDSTLGGSIKELKVLLTEELHENDRKMVESTEALVKEVSNNLDQYQFNYAAERLYDFAWHEFADVYIEDVKNRIDETSYTVLISCFSVMLKLFHPFMPFITEEIYQTLPGHTESIMISKWPLYETK